MFPAFGMFCDFILFLIYFLSIISLLVLTLFHFCKVPSALATPRLSSSGPLGTGGAAPAPSFRGRVQTPGCLNHAFVK